MCIPDCCLAQGHDDRVLVGFSDRPRHVTSVTDVCPFFLLVIIVFFKYNVAGGATFSRGYPACPGIFSSRVNTLLSMGVLTAVNN